MPARIPVTVKQRDALLTLPDTEETVVRYHSLEAAGLSPIRVSRTARKQLGYGLQLCALRYPGRYFRKGEVLPAIMLDHIAEQINFGADVIPDFARRSSTRYEQLAIIKRRHGFKDLTRPARAKLALWLANEALRLIDGKVLIERLILLAARDEIL